MRAAGASILRDTSTDLLFSVMVRSSLLFSSRSGLELQPGATPAGAEW